MAHTAQRMPPLAANRKPAHLHVHVVGAVIAKVVLAHVGSVDERLEREQPQPAQHRRLVLVEGSRAGAPPGFQLHHHLGQRLLLDRRLFGFLL